MRNILLLCLGLLVGLPTVAQAEWRPFLFLKNTGGLNDSFDPTAIADDEASAIQNFVFTTGGAISKRQGFTEINSTAISATADFTGGLMYKQSDGDRFLVALVSDGGTDTIQKMDYSGGTGGPDGTWDNISGSLSLGFGADDQADFATAFDIVVIEDGVNTTAPYQWTGSGDAIDLGGSPPNATMVEYHKNHMWSAGNNTNPSRVTFSNLATTFADIETWSAADFFEIETNDGQVVRSLKSALNCLYIFKDFSIWRICGTNRDDFTQEQMVTGYGTLSNDSVKIINNKFLFKTSVGDYAVYDGGIEVEIISSKIEGTLTAFNQDRVDNVRSEAFDDGTGDRDYYACETGSGSGTNNRVLLYDTLHQAWTVFVGINCNAIWTYELGTLQQALAFGDYTGTANRYPDGNSDNTAAIAAFYTTKQYSFPTIPQDKTFRLLEVYVNQEGNYNLTATIRADFEATGTASDISLGGSGALWDTAIFDTDTWADLITTIGRIEINDRRRFLEIRYENNNADEPVTIKGWLIWVEPEGRV